MDEECRKERLLVDCETRHGWRLAAVLLARCRVNKGKRSIRSVEERESHAQRARSPARARASEEEVKADPRAPRPAPLVLIKMDHIACARTVGWLARDQQTQETLLAGHVTWHGCQARGGPFARVLVCGRWRWALLALGPAACGLADGPFRRSVRDAAGGSLSGARV